MDDLSPSFDATGSAVAQAPKASSPAIISPSIPAPPSPPRRQTVSSASEMPHKDIRAAVFSQHVASSQYVEHHRKATEALRQQHREERAMWDVERQELLLKVAELEAKITRMANLGGSNIPSITEKLSKYSISSSTAPTSASASSSSIPAVLGRDQNLSPSSGGPPGSISIDRHASKPHMDSIPEGHETGERAKSVSFAITLPSADHPFKELEGQVVPGELVDKDLDGVIIKASSLPVSVQKAILEDSHSATPSPLQSPSPRKRSPGDTSAATPTRPVTIEFPSTNKILQLPSRALYTHDAGHTPLARVTDDMSEEGTGAATPNANALVYTAEQEKPPLEPHPSTYDGKPLRPPHERGDSYFNVPVPPTKETKAEQPIMRESHKTATDETQDEDPALTGPLSLPHQPSKDGNKKGNNDFLEELDQKLTSLSKEQDIPKRASLSASDAGGRENGDPPLRIKRSLNFGSAWGSGIAGRDA